MKVLLQYVEALKIIQLSFRMLQNAEHTRLPFLSTTGSCEKRACWRCSSTCCGESLVCTVCTLLQAGRAALRQPAQGIWRPRSRWQPACLSRQLSAGLRCRQQAACAGMAAGYSSGYFRHGLKLHTVRMPVSSVTPGSHLFMTSCSFLLPSVSKAMSAKVRMPRRRLPSPPDDVMQTLQAPLCSWRGMEADYMSSWRHALVQDCISVGGAARAPVLLAKKDCLAAPLSVAVAAAVPVQDATGASCLAAPHLLQTAPVAELTPLLDMQAHL